MDWPRDNAQFPSAYYVLPSAKYMPEEPRSERSSLPGKASWARGTLFTFFVFPPSFAVAIVRQ